MLPKFTRCFETPGKYKIQYDQPFMRGTTKNQNKVGTYLWDTLYYKYFIFPYHKYKCSVIMLCKQLNYAFIMDVGIY